jgi:hypothetical protein
MSKKAASYNQIKLIDALQKQIGLEAYNQIKSNLRINKPLYEISSGSAGVFINELKRHKAKSRSNVPPVKSSRQSDIVDMRRALENMIRKLRGYSYEVG